MNNSVNSKKVSIIIPVYNVEKYLTQCLDSIVKQTYKNLEIILINDGSTDNSLNICKKYLYDKRVLLIDKKNGGMSDARNKGLDIMTGDYVTFIDSDDYVSLNYVDTLVKLIQRDKLCSIAICNYKKVYNDSCDFKTKRVKFCKYSSNEAIREMFYQKRFDTSFRGKIFIAKLFNGIRLPVGKWHEDLATVHKLFNLSEFVIYSNVVLYAYRQQEQSIMHSKFNIRIFDYFEINQTLENLYSKNKVIFKAMKSRVVVNCLNLMIKTDYNLYKNEYEKAWKDFTINRKYVLFSGAKFKVILTCFASYLLNEKIIYLLKIIK